MTTSSLLRRVVFVALAGSGAAVQGQAHAAGSGAAKSRPPIAYSITGSVVNSVGGGRVAHCRLTAAPVVRGGAGNRRFPADLDSYDCDESGHFVIPVPSAGAWRVSASAPGFVTQAYDEHQLFSSAVVLTAAKPTFDLQFKINPESSITGVVLDEAGEPVRTAQISLQTVPEVGPDGVRPVGRVRSTTRTDDRGMYELGNIAPGSYRVMVQAQPWYAAASQPGRGGATTQAVAVDSSLDVAYPIAWFPGVEDAAQAEEIVLHAGDSRQADFHLTPVPSIHLHILPGANQASNGGGGFVFFPSVQQVVPGSGSRSFIPVTVHTDAQGQVDVGGLAPGVYQIRIAGPNQVAQSTTVELATGSARTVSLGDASDQATVTLHFDGAVYTESKAAQVNFIDTASGRSVSTGSGPGFGGEGGPGDLRRRERREPDTERTVQLSPGRYEVVLQGRQDLYLTGMTAKGAESLGRYVTVAAGASSLMLHIASGRASLSGVASFENKPLAGALVLLVPTSVEDGTSLRIVRRDQTNTDGSFELADVIPGQYILVAINNGWQINWGDPGTLRRYLTQGVPVDLSSSASTKQNVSAQAP